jgi:hypothetical protein
MVVVASRLNVADSKFHSQIAEIRPIPREKLRVARRDEGMAEMNIFCAQPFKLIGVETD